MTKIIGAPRLSAFTGRDEMKFKKGPILAALVIAVGSSLTACVEHKDPVGPEPPPPETGDSELRAGQIYSGKTLVRLA